MPPPLPAPLVRSASGLFAFQQGQFALQAVAEEEGEEEEDEEEEEDDKDGEEASVQVESREDDIKREKVGILAEKVPNIAKKIFSTSIKEPYYCRPPWEPRPPPSSVEAEAVLPLLQDRGPGVLATRGHLQVNSQKSLVFI